MCTVNVLSGAYCTTALGGIGLAGVKGGCPPEAAATAGAAAALPEVSAAASADAVLPEVCVPVVVSAFSAESGCVFCVGLFTVAASLPSGAACASPAATWLFMPSSVGGGVARVLLPGVSFALFSVWPPFGAAEAARWLAALRFPVGRCRTVCVAATGPASPSPVTGGVQMVPT